VLVPQAANVKANTNTATRERAMAITPASPNHA
jgi:hypothetical protein